MRTFMKTGLLGLGLVLSLFGCSDHRLGGALSPVRLRLKTVQGGTLNTTYTYDNQNRLATITKADGSLSVYSYNDTNKTAELRQYPNPADQTAGTVIQYVFMPTGTEATIGTLAQSKVYIGGSYTFGRVSYSSNPATMSASVSRYHGISDGYNGSFYTYTGKNPTTGGFVAGHSNLDNKAYEYDDKINPLFGLTDPSILTDKAFLLANPNNDDILRLSTNNVTKITTTSYYDPKTVYQTIVYQYEYNQQGLPTKRTTQGGSEVITYTYEAY